MTNQVLTDNHAAPLAGFRSGLARFFEFLADTSRGMRCAREAERLLRLSDEELARLGLRRDQVVRHAFAPYLGL